ncbi:DUF421 domain-containing protein [Aquibacillus kalidii]|uniref:DUF421 domain-containing protein n=1 Tax=Aquibacillus kalidii TaxID=2762597 RepID=UPI001648499D|nr:DUF421 domain-containing protein [Aquibacillus kalidii]
MSEWLNVVLRSVSLLIILFVITTILGKKQLSQLSVFEYITGITIGSIVAEIAISTERKFSHGIIGVAVWFFIPLFVSFLAIRNKKFRDIVEGKGTVFVKDGKILENNLKKEKFTTDELLEKLRNKNIFQITDVEFAVLETDGSLSVLQKKENQPLTPKDLGVTVASIKEPQTVIMDGEILLEPLASTGMSVNWLKTELTLLDVSLDNVFLGQIDQSGELTVDLYDDQLKAPTSKEKPLLLARLKKCQAEMELLALTSEDKKGKQMYYNNSNKLKEAVEKITPYLN